MARKKHVTSLYEIIFLSALSYFSAGFVISLSNINSDLIYVGFGIFLVGVVYDFFAIREYNKKTNLMENRIQNLENNVQNITEILYDVKDILKK